jgi:hypothetical protein
MTTIADRVFLARHGQTALNAQGRLLGQLDPALSDAPQRTACWNELSGVDGVWRVDAYDLVAE